MFTKNSKETWMKGKTAYVEKFCVNCRKEFLGRKGRKTNRWCSQECFQKFVEQKNSHALTAKDIDIINGLLLSDGCITKPHTGKNYYLTHCSIIKSYSDFVSSELSFPIKQSLQNGRRMKAGYMGKESFHLRTQISPVWTAMHKRWYPENKKIVPEIDLCPVTCLHWYLGDGNLDNTKGITLCTDSFTVSCIKFLRAKLHELGFSTLTNARNRVIIPNSSVYEFLDYIGMSPVPEFAYKWDTIVKQSYRGRKCLDCNLSFDTTVNHKKCCSDKCYQRYWQKRTRDHAARNKRVEETQESIVQCGRR